MIINICISGRERTHFRLHQIILCLSVSIFATQCLCAERVCTYVWLRFWIYIWALFNFKEILSFVWLWFMRSLVYFTIFFVFVVDCCPYTNTIYPNEQCAELNKRMFVYTPDLFIKYKYWICFRHDDIITMHLNIMFETVVL